MACRSSCMGARVRRSRDRRLGHQLPAVYELDLFAETYMSALVTGSSDAEERVSAEAIGGLKIHVEKRSFLFLAGGGGYTPGFRQPAFARCSASCSSPR